MGPLCSRSLPAFGLVLSMSACQALAEVDVRYEDCLQPDTSPYVEEFSADYQSLVDRCWRSANTETSTILVDDGDLVIRPDEPALWDDNGTPPLLSLRAEGDFLIATRVEAATGQNVCLDPLDRAGLVVRNPETLAWATLLVQPAYPPNPDNDADCGDSAEHVARASLDSSGFPGSVELTPLEFGEDGEGDVAICRRGNYLFYYYRDVETNVWLTLADAQEVDRGLLEVGLTTTSGVGLMTGIEGHFNSVAYWSELAGDACGRQLEDFTLPEEP